MQVLWMGIGCAFACLALASLLHFLYVRRKAPYVHHPDSIGFIELYDLAKWIVILEVGGFIIACIAALVDAGLITL